MKLGMIAPTHTEESFEKIKRLGMENAELDVNCDDVYYLKSEEVNKWIQAHNVKVGAVGRWGRNRINTDGTLNKKELDDEKYLIDFCVKTDCPVYITGINYVNELSYYLNITAAIEYIKELINYSKGRVKICTYNCSWNNYIDKAQEWNIIHTHLPELGIKFDPSHTINGGRDYLNELVTYGKLFYHVHLKGTININGVRVDDPPAGLDTINWGALLSILHKYKYDGMLSIEPHSETWQGELGDKGLKYTIGYFKKLLFIE